MFFLPHSRGHRFWAFQGFSSKVSTSSCLAGKYVCTELQRSFFFLFFLTKIIYVYHSPKQVVDFAGYTALIIWTFLVCSGDCFCSTSTKDAISYFQGVNTCVRKCSRLFKKTLQHDLSLVAPRLIYSPH